MFLIVGLGNPGKEYTFTYHNLGFLSIDFLSQKHKIDVDKVKHKAIIGKGQINGQDVVLAKPQTYMNLSGESIREIADWYKVPAEQIIIIYDDINLDIGKIRVRARGSHGGHNGMKSIICHLNSEEFPRIRIGIAKDEESINMDMPDYVISKIKESHKEPLYKAIENTARSAEYIIQNNIQKAMNEFN